MRNIGKEFGEILADYQVGRTTGVLFLRFVPSFRIIVLLLYPLSILAVCDTIGYIQNTFISALKSLDIHIIFASFC